MFDLDAGKLIVIGIVALIAIPSKDLPRVLRQAGQFAGRVRRMAGEFQDQLMQAMREAELEEVKKDIHEIDQATNAGLGGAFDPLHEARKEIASAIEAAPARPAPAAEEISPAPRDPQAAPDGGAGV